MAEAGLSLMTQSRRLNGQLPEIILLQARLRSIESFGCLLEFLIDLEVQTTVLH